MKKKFVSLIIILSVLLAAFLGFKLYHLSKYNTNGMQTQRVKVDEPVTLLNKKLNENDYFLANDMMIKNDFRDFKQFDLDGNDKLVSYVLYDEDNKVKAAIKFFDYVTYVSGFSSNVGIFGDSKIDKSDINDYMENHKFKNDFELIKYLANLNDEKINIFTSIDKMKDNYISHYLVSLILVEGSYREIQGDYTGYLLKSANDTVEVNIAIGEKKYIISFMQLDYFTDNYIYELISTFKIK